MNGDTMFSLNISKLTYGAINYTIVLPDARYISGQRPNMAEVNDAFTRAIAEYEEHERRRAKEAVVDIETRFPGAIGKLPKGDIRNLTISSDGVLSVEKVSVAPGHQVYPLVWDPEEKQWDQPDSMFF
jgi:hypothetical protein